jgi:hypothetical protein
MKLRVFLVLTFLFTLVFATNSHARKPAVEDFVGVETENYRPTTKGTEVLFNFGNHIDSLEKKRRAKQQTAGWIATATLAAFILLPFFMWIGITNSLKNANDNEEVVADHKPEVQTLMQADNVKHLSDYQSDNSDDDDIKKAS